jgi:hypothetical protein
MRRCLVPVGLLLTLSGAAAAQTPTTEVDVTAGYSTQGLSAVATQMRTFGELKTGLRYFAEAAGAAHSGPESDAFSSAYYYEGGMAVSEAYLEQHFHTARSLSGVRVGRYRTPFGIYDRSDYAYNGFLRPPLVRYGYYQGISNYWLEGGVNGFIGTPHLQLGASVGVPQEDEETRRRGLNAVVRLQGYRGPLILGASYMHTRPYPSKSYIHGNGYYTGVDARWMRGGVQLRGEWISGVPFQNARIQGWYIDAMLHRPALGSVSPVLRYEDYKYDAPGYPTKARRWTAGARVRITPSLSASMNLLRGRGLQGSREQALDVAITHALHF